MYPKKNRTIANHSETTLTSFVAGAFAIVRNGFDTRHISVDNTLNGLFGTNAVTVLITQARNGAANKNPRRKNNIA